MLSSGASLGILTPLQYISQYQNDKFLRNQRLGNYGQNPSRIDSGRYESYTTAKRGVLCEQGQEDNPDRILIFQFNPETITDAKSNNYNTKSYTGFTFNDNIWASGGERIINFKLNFEATAGVNTPLFGKNSTYGNAQVDTLLNFFPRGTLDMVELLASFQYPTQQNPDAPRFSNGGFIPSPKFMPPPIVVFSYGNYYLQGIVSEVSFNHTQVNSDLIPERTEADVTFKVSEQNQITYKPINGTTTFRDTPPTVGEPTTNPNNVA